MTDTKTIRAALEAATPGPWHWSDDDPYLCGPYDAAGCRWIVLDGHELACGDGADAEDALLIANAPTWLAELCDRLDELEALAGESVVYAGALGEAKRRAEAAEGLCVMTKDEWKETSEFWRSAAVAWQTWADELLGKRELQPTGGVHGAVSAREIIAGLCDEVDELRAASKSLAKRVVDNGLRAEAAERLCDELCDKLEAWKQIVREVARWRRVSDGGKSLRDVFDACPKELLP